MPRGRKKTSDSRSKDSKSVELTQNDKDTFEKNTMINERLITIEKIIELYPNLKKDKHLITNYVLNKTETKINETVLNRIIINGQTYYYGADNNIIDGDVNLVGIVAIEKNEKKFILFSDIKKYH